MGFLKTNAAKIGLAVVLLAAAVAAFLIVNRKPSPVSGDLTFVCVATGKVYQIGRSKKALIVPLENPDTHELTLLPCAKDAGGYYISGRYRGMLKEFGDKNRYVDTETLRLRSGPG